MQLVFFFGRTPQLSLRELERAAQSLPFQWSLSILRQDIVVLKSNGDSIELEGSDSVSESQKMRTVCAMTLALQQRLGGTVKIGLLRSLGSVEAVTRAIIEQILTESPEGKLQLGISSSNPLQVRPEKVGFSVKKALQAKGRSIRLILPTKGGELNSMQILGNRLCYSGDQRREVHLLSLGGQVALIQTLTVQDSVAYRKRDYSIPIPDPASGMLPPKLAQAMVNLGHPGEGGVVWDPFCGNGRVLGEALLMGLSGIGSDISEKKVQATQENIAWLSKEFAVTQSVKVGVRDATKPWTNQELAQWKISLAGRPYAVVSEPYLGPALRHHLSKKDAELWAEALVPLYLGFFLALRSVVREVLPQRIVVVFPAIFCQAGTVVGLRERLVDRLHEMGYSASQVSLYGRPDSFVQREIMEISFSEPKIK
jgi:tRNA G10  N-methylase Trm11